MGAGIPSACSTSCGYAFFVVTSDMSSDSYFPYECFYPSLDAESHAAQSFRINMSELSGVFIESSYYFSSVFFASWLVSWLPSRRLLPV